MTTKLIPTLLALTATCYGQAPGIVDLGYGLPRMHRLAPGQVVTIFVSGLPSSKRAVATAVPLPTTLAGTSVRLEQGASTFQLPIFAIEPADSSSTGITVQIPYELQPSDTFTLRRGSLSVTVDGNVLPRMEFVAVNARVHFVTDCDKGVFRFPETFQNAEPLCPAIVTHADGSRVSSSSPARAGETLIAFAFGMGRTNPQAVTGNASPAGAITVESLTIAFDFRRSSTDVPVRIGSTPIFAGLTAGLVGLYQVNFRVPDQAPADLASCGPLFGNVQLTLSSTTGTDVLSFCLQAQN